jgi:hypothetical protein
MYHKDVRFEDADRLQMAQAVVDFCKHGNEPSNPITGENLLSI